MYKFSLLLLMVLCFYNAKPQGPNPAIDTLSRQLLAAKTAARKVELLGGLSRLYMSQNIRVADSLGSLMIQEAELSRDRKLMVKALLVNGERNTYLATRKENLDKAIEFYNRALELAKQNNLDKEIALSYIYLSAIYRTVPDADKAAAYMSEANSYLSMSDDDSLQVIGKLEEGNVSGLKREKKSSLQKYLGALRLAEELKNPELERQCYNALIGFYDGIEDYDKAIDYAVKAMDASALVNKDNKAYQRVANYIGIGNLYSLKKSYDVANYYFQQAIRMADSLRYEPLKIPAYLGILNNYLNSGQPSEALQYLNASKEVKDFASKFGLSGQIDYGYAYIYTDLGKYDSAKYYYEKASPFFEHSSNEASKYVYYFQLGRMYKLSGDNKKAADNFLKAKVIGESVKDPERIETAAKELDTVYFKMGDYRQSKLYSALYYQYKDSIDKLGKEKDLVQAEAADEQQRHERKLKEEEENQRRKNNIQYTAITMGIVILLILLVVMGMFRVSAGFIKALGFFVFLMLFEFIFLVFKKNIHSITHGEPWKDLAFMIGLAALLVPLHHWVEHRVLHYLTSHNRLTQAGHHIKNKLFRRNKE
jgi:tetratricopeptide (TPR) repeat protein